MLQKEVLKSSFDFISHTNEKEATKFFRMLCQRLNIDGSEKNMKNLVIYEMIDGMRTSAELSGIEAYIEGGLFSVRLIRFLKFLGAKACYINVTEEKHKQRSNYPEILEALRQLYPFYEEFVKHYKVKCKFLGRIEESLDDTSLFMKELRVLEEDTASNAGFTACFLINYSLEWSLQNMDLFEELPDINVVIRHTKFQVPTGMLLPPSKSDNTSLVYVQQGAPSRTWSDHQILCLIALALRSMLLNYGTQYTKTYSAKEREEIRTKREIEAVLVHKQLLEETIKLSPSPIAEKVYRNKRVILGTPFGPEIYEF